MPTKGQICAIKDIAFQATSKAMGIKDLPGKMQGGQVKLVSALAWSIREMRLSGLDQVAGGKLEFNLKLDGRPFWGKQHRNNRKPNAISNLGQRN